MKKKIPFVIVSVVAGLSVLFILSKQLQETSGGSGSTVVQGQLEPRVADDSLGDQLAEVTDISPTASRKIVDTAAEPLVLQVADSPAPLNADLEFIVRQLPTWSEGDEYFEEKYRFFTEAQLLKADEMLGPILHEETEPLVQSRLAMGDYEIPEPSDDGSEMRFKDYTGQERFTCARIMSIMAPDGSLTQVRMRFTSQEYPLIYYRSREQGWIANNLHQRGFRYENGDYPTPGAVELK